MNYVTVSALTQFDPKNNYFVLVKASKVRLATYELCTRVTDFVLTTFFILFCQSVLDVLESFTQWNWPLRICKQVKKHVFSSDWFLHLNNLNFRFHWQLCMQDITSPALLKLNCFICILIRQQVLVWYIIHLATHSDWNRDFAVITDVVLRFSDCEEG